MKVRLLAASDVDPRDYLDGANLAFGHWGDESTFAWAFRGGAELLFLGEDGERPQAGSAITYRTIRYSDGRTTAAAIMTGSWTMPHARGLGLFSRMIEATCDAARSRNALVLGFGRMENASRRRFDAAQAGMHPSFYLRSAVGNELAQDGPFTSAAGLERMEPSPALFPAHGTGFVYSPAEWRAQHVDRPGGRVECLGRAGVWAALVERADGFDRVHALSDEAALPALAARARAAGRQLFWYATRPPHSAIGVEWTTGFLATLPPSPITDWAFQNGDRM
jgi:GNAT superfamily N-acetyltransferase